MNSPMEIFLNGHYQRSFEKLKHNQRSFPKLSTQELQQLLSYFQECLQQQTPSPLFHQFFFILSYIQNETLQFEEPLLKIFIPTFYPHLTEDTKLLHLSAIQKQVIKVYKKQGSLIPHTILSPLNNQLRSSSPSLQYWILHFLTDLGPELAYFKQTLLHIKPSFFKLLLPQYNKMLPLIEVLFQKMPPTSKTRKNDSAR
jgi:hypothetical protein